jgi:lantibiotic biosynthesis protein
MNQTVAERASRSSPLAGHSCRFVVLRTPLLPYEEFCLWGRGLTAGAAATDGGALEVALERDRAHLRERLRALVLRPEVGEAIRVASPALHRSLPVWLEEPDGPRARRVERALTRYLTRMATRATPFGILAGWSVGVPGPDTRLQIAARPGYRRFSRPSSEYLFAIASRTARDPQHRAQQRYWANTSIYRAGGRLKYVVAGSSLDARSYEVVSVEPSFFLDQVLTVAAAGAYRAELIQSLTSGESDIDEDEAGEYVNELIESQLLVSELIPSVTGPEPTLPLADALARLGEQPVAQSLRRAAELLSQADALPVGESSGTYVEAGALLAAAAGWTADADAPVEPTSADQDRAGPRDPPAAASSPIQVDMWKPAPGLTVGPVLLREVKRSIDLLYRITPPVDELEGFRREFSERYGDREVPLAEALDEETGIGFDGSRNWQGSESPLLVGLRLGKEAEERRPGWEPRHEYLLRRIMETERAGRRELLLEERDLEALSPARRLPMPRALSIMVTLLARSARAVDRGEFRLSVGFAVAPSPAHLFGRFLHADPQLARFALDDVREEESAQPDVTFAEIVHLPDVQAGNVVLRPTVRRYELPYLGRSGVRSEDQLPIEDLHLSLRAGRVVLRSRRLDRPIQVRLTCAHNFFPRKNLALYRFLCVLTRQNQAGPLIWSWGPLARAPFLPRVVAGRTILSAARWCLTRNDLEPLAALRGPALFRAIRDLRSTLRLPGRVLLEDRDNLLLVDLENVLSVEAFLHSAKGKDEVVLLESLVEGTDDLCVRGPEGLFVHELIVPLVVPAEAAQRSAGPGATSVPAPRLNAASLPGPRPIFAPPSEWLFLKLYCGRAAADALLLELVRPWVEEALATGAADRWFFIRYSDPDWHLRVRLHGEQDRLFREVLRSFQRRAAPYLATGCLHKVQLDTYEPETERYGGPQGIELAERLFCVESRTALMTLEGLEGSLTSTRRWQAAVCGVDVLLEGLGLPLRARCALLGRMSAAFAREFEVTSRIERDIAGRFRQHRDRLRTLVEHRTLDDAALDPAILALRAGGQHLAPLGRELAELERRKLLTDTAEQLAWSFVHMHVNRILRTAHRAHEVVLYTFLRKLYETEVACRPDRVEPIMGSVA